MWMKHEANGLPTPVVESAFADYWQHHGWSECDPPPEPDEDDAEIDAVVEAAGLPPRQAKFTPAPADESEDPTPADPGPSKE